MRIRTALVLAALAAAGVGLYRTQRMYQGFEGQVFVDIPHGASTTGIARMMADAGVAPSRWDFLLACILERGRKLQAGEYAFVRPATPIEVYRRIARGDVFFYELKVPEGKNMFEIGVEAGKLGAFSEQDFLAAARNPESIHDLDPKAPTLEGYLFPGVYRINRTTTAEDLCKAMTGRFRAAWHSLHAKADVHEAVTVASLVEKEDKLAEERPLIAAVYDNRLRIGMKLDCDPTVIYAAERHDAYRGVIHQSDLERDDPYNTYRLAGLPPGPICNPGLPSMEAALDPAPARDLYFVLRPDGSGGHEFSVGLAAHQAAVDRYRRGRR